MKFLDEAKVYIRSGNGGPGSMSFRREANVPFGGPDGGNGGSGGDIFIESIDNLNTLIDFRYRQHFKAKSGNPGMGKNRTGLSASPLTLFVPTGTQVLAEDKITIIADLMRAGEKKLLAKGGRGGRGNSTFKSSTNQTPYRHDPGQIGQEYWIWLRLKLIADVGIIGLPNAGKSTFLSSVSAAKPKIADYPFTTLNPQMGVVRNYDNEFVIADIPGLIAGANKGTGLGTRFLGHIERCNILLHIIDGTKDDVVLSYKIIRNELKEYGFNLSKKTEIIALNKSDSSKETEFDTKMKLLRDVSGNAVLPLSAISNIGSSEIVNTLYNILNKNIS